MAADTSVMLGGIGPQMGYGQPFGGPYTNVYGFTPGSTAAQDAYQQSILRGYQNQQNQLVQDAFGNQKGVGGWNGMENAVSYDPTTGQYSFDPTKISQQDKMISMHGDEDYRKQFEKMKGDTNEDRMQARQRLEALAQQRAANAARVEQQQAEVAGFQRELSRYQSPDLMRQMINPAMQQASNQAMSAANAAGMAGGSMGQAANRRAAMMGMGNQAAQIVPQAAVQQAGQDFNWQKAREGMINNYYQMQNERATRDLQNSMAQTSFQKAMEEYEHNRSMEGLKMATSVAQNFGNAVLKTSPVAGGEE